MALLISIPTSVFADPDPVVITTLNAAIEADQTEFPAAKSELSYWGPLPQRHDSVTIRVHNTPRPTWEKAIRIPWYVGAVPFRITSRFVQGSIILADRHGLYRQVKRLIGPMEGPFGMKLRLGAGNLEGPALGLDTVHHAFLGPGNEMQFKVLSSLLGVFKSTLGLKFGVDRNTGILFSAGFSQLGHARYHGRGPGTFPEMKAEYVQELAWLGGGLTKGLARDLHLRGTVYASSAGAKAGDTDDDDHHSIEELFPVLPSGYGERSMGLISCIELLHDSTTDDGRPGGGDIYNISLSHFHETSGLGDDIVTVKVGAEQFLDLPNSGQTFALRSYCHWMFSADVDSIPFQRLLTNAAPHLLRGYPSYRWRDRGLAAMSLEYRWPFWVNKRADRLGIDLFLFTDIGQVFGELNEFDTSNFTRSWGGGFRLIGNGGFAGRLELGHSDEGTIWRLQFYQVFQYAKGGILHGFSQAVLH
jgi:hypothetical protein